MPSDPDPAAQLRVLPLSSPFLEVWFNGLYLGLVLFAVWATLSKRESKAVDRTWLAIVVLMYVLATIHAAIDWWLEVSAFTNYGGTPAIVTAISRGPIWNKALGATVFVLNTLIADCLFIWRCWVVWERSWHIVVLPTLGTVAGTVLAVISIIGQIQVAKSRTPGAVSRHFVTFSTPYFVLSLAISLLTTALIALRVIMVNWSFTRIGTTSVHRRSYSRMMEILVESAAIYSVNLLVFVALTVAKNPRLSYPQNIHPQIAGIAPTLIVLRVALGYARADSEWSTQKASTADMSFYKSDSFPPSSDKFADYHSNMRKDFYAATSNHATTPPATLYESTSFAMPASPTRTLDLEAASAPVREHSLLQ